MKMESKVRRGFTLIELLVVIAIILILSGIVLRATALVLRHMAQAKAVADLEHIQNALNEFYAEYGSYPPCSDVTYQYEGDLTHAQHNFAVFLQNAQYNSTNMNQLSQFFADAARTYPGGVTNTGFGGQTLYYNYGLVAYLWRRARGYRLPDLYPANCFDYTNAVRSQQSHTYEGDTARDLLAKDRWAHFLIGPDGDPRSSRAPVRVSSRDSDLHVANIGSRVPYTNVVDTILDPWRSDYRYISQPPYQGYKLWSVGPDGVSGSSDDVNADSVRRQ